MGPHTPFPCERVTKRSFTARRYDNLSSNVGKPEEVSVIEVKPLDDIAGAENGWLIVTEDKNV
jgi:hypothetical protein